MSPILQGKSLSYNATKAISIVCENKIPVDEICKSQPMNYFNLLNKKCMLKLLSATALA